MREGGVPAARVGTAVTCEPDTQASAPPSPSLDALIAAYGRKLAEFWQNPVARWFPQPASSWKCDDEQWLFNHRLRLELGQRLGNPPNLLTLPIMRDACARMGWPASTMLAFIGRELDRHRADTHALIGA